MRGLDRQAICRPVGINVVDVSSDPGDALDAPGGSRLV
jgi:hypothetical protein